MGQGNHKYFVLFIVFCSLDFLFNAVLGILDYFGVYNQNQPIFSQVPLYTEETSLAISLFCALALVVVLPICYVQVTNVVWDTTTHQRFAFKTASQDSKDPEIDSASMLLKDSEEWIYENSRNSQEIQEGDQPTSACCKKSPKVLESMQINETVPLT